MHSTAGIEERESLILKLSAQHSELKAKKEGVFYTPSRLARVIAKSGLDPFLHNASVEQILNLKILDPACGVGALLIEAFILLRERLAQLNADNKKNSAHILRNCLFGIDKDEKAVKTARQLLRLSGQDAADAENLHVANALFDQRFLQNEYKREIKDFHKLFSDVLSRPNPGFDCVLANPPYGISRDDKLAKWELAAWRKAQKEHSSGKLNKYMMFIVRGLELLRNGGSMSYIVPNAWLGIRDGESIRKLLCKSRSLEKLNVYHFKLFPSLGVETVILKIKKGAKAREVKVLHHYKNSVESRDQTFVVPYSVWDSHPAYELPLRWNKGTSRLRSNLSNGTFNLDSEHSPFIPRIALQAYAKGKGTPPQTSEDVKHHVYHSMTRDSPQHIKYLEGRDVSRFAYDWSGKFLHYGPWLAEAQKLERFKGPRIILREILNAGPYPINACFIDEPALYNKSTLHILPKSPILPETLHALLLILNSSMAGEIIKTFGKKSNRNLFPKLLNSDLKSFPLPHDFLSKISQLSEPCIELQLLHNQEPTTKILAKIDRIQAAADRLVTSLYVRKKRGML